MAKAELPEGIQERLDTLEESMTALEAELEPLLSTPWDVLTSKMEPLEKAKLNLMIAYAADSLFFLYLKTQGQSAEDHPVTEELARVKEYMQKLKAVVGRAEEGVERSTKLNKEAAARFIKAGIGAKEEKGDGKEAKKRKTQA
mmetsp:Transcript_14798/g.35755  ORF Transcript_14798/g.35755 Transcript_14798/m.35755 type:complete len:143 (+) Transcript_14798:120-548(+)